MRMDCKRVRELLPEYADGRLDSGWSGSLVDHLSGCASCGRELTALRETWRMLLAYRPIEAELAARVKRRIHGPFARFIRIAAPLAAAAAVLVVIAIIVHSPPTSDMDAVVAREWRKMSEEDRSLLRELARDEDRELAENMEWIEALELLAGDRWAEGADPFSRNGH